MDSQPTAGSWLIIDDVIRRYSPFWDESPPEEATFVQKVPDAITRLAEHRYDVLSLDYNLNVIGAGTTQPLVDWLCESDQVAEYSHKMTINIHSSDYCNAQRIAEQLAAAGYKVSRQAIS